MGLWASTNSQNTPNGHTHTLPADATCAHKRIYKINKHQPTCVNAAWNLSCTSPVQLPPCMKVQGTMRRWSWMAPPCARCGGSLSE